MLDPRIYRAAFVPAALAVVVLAFSLYDQQGGATTALAPDAFNAQNAWTTMNGLAHDYPNRAPGSASDTALATWISRTFSRHSLPVATQVFTAQTADGPRTIETVTGVRTGFSSRPIVVVAHRDARGSPAIAEMSGTAVLAELARVLAGQTLNRTVELVSTSASVGAAGADRLARDLGTTPDAVLVLGDLASARLRYPLVIPWSDGTDVAPPMYRNTVAAALGAQSGLTPGGVSFGGQFARLAFPLAITEQGPFGARAVPSVLFSASGDRAPTADAPASLARLMAFGRTALQTIGALEAGPAVPAPGPYLVYDKKVVPGWAIRLFVLTLILPVLAASVDGYARARRRGHAVGRWTAWVLAGAVPFVLGAGVIIALKLTDVLHAAPPAPVDPNSVPPHGAGIAILASLALLIVLSLAFVRPMLARLAGAHGEPTNGAGAAMVLVMCAVTLAIWVTNPFAAALIVPALHLWMWVADPQAHLGRPARFVLLLVGVTPLVLIAAYYAVTLGTGPVGLAWTGVLMVAGGHLTPLATLEWSIVLGCLTSAALIARHATQHRHAAEGPITMRGPVTYAGPGSLGGTESALRR